MPISQYTKIVPLELKDDKSTEILLGSLKKKVAKDDEAQAKIQAYADSVGSIDIVKESDKQYFDKKYSEAIESINSNKSFDFSNPSNIRAMAATVDSLLYDPTITNAITSTKYFRQVNKEIEEAINNPKLKHIYNEDTIAYDRAKQEEYINSTDPKSSFSQQHMTIYDGYKENTQKAINDVKERTKHIVGENGLMMETKGKNAFAVQAAIEQGIGSSKMPMIEFTNLTKRDPNAISKIYGGIRADVAKKKDDLSKAEATLASQPADSPYYKQQKTYVDNLKAQIDGFSGVLSRPENAEDAFRIFLHNKKETYLKPALDVDEIRKVDPVYKLQSDVNYRNTMGQHTINKDTRDYNLRVAESEQNKYMDAQNLELDRRELDIKERELDIKERESYLKGSEKKAADEINDVTGMSATGTSIIGGGPNAYIIDAPVTEAIKGQENPALKFSSDITRYNTESAAALSKINSLLTEPETRAMVSNALKAKGFTKGLESLKVGAISPANIYKMKAVLDDIFTEGVAKNYLTDAVSNQLRILSDNNAKTILRSSVNTQVFNTVFKTMGIKAGTRMSSLTPEQQKEVFKKSEVILDQYGLSTIEGKKRIRTNFDKEKGKEVLTNQLKASFTNNLANVTDLKGNKVKVKFDAAHSTINSVDSDGYAYVTLKNIPKDAESTGELVGNENGYKFKLDANTFQAVKDGTIGRNSAFGRPLVLDDYLKVAALDVAATTGLGNISHFANSLDGLPAKMIVPFRVTSANSDAFHIKLPYTGGDKMLTKGQLEIGNYTITTFKSTTEFKSTLAAKTREALALVNKMEATKGYSEDQKIRIAKDMAIATIVGQGYKSK
jgi:hypothetical protein